MFYSMRYSWIKRVKYTTWSLCWIASALLCGQACNGNYPQNNRAPEKPTNLSPVDESQQLLPTAQLDDAGLPPLHACQDPQPAPQQLRRLTKQQLTATLQSLLPAGTALPSLDGIRDPSFYAFHNNADRLLVDNNIMVIWQPIAEQIATLLAAQLEREQMSSCSQSKAQCWQTALGQLARQLFRVSALPSDLQQSYEKLFSDLLALTEPLLAAQDTITTMLTSPYFWFSQELGTPMMATPQQFALSADEISSMFALTWLQQPPSDQLRAQFQAALASPDVKAALLAIGQQYLPQVSANSMVPMLTDLFRLPRLGQLIKDAAVYPNFDQSLATAMAEESTWLLTTIADPEANASFRDLFRYEQTKLPAKLAQTYGLSPSEAPIAIQQIKGRLPGILGHPSILSIHADPATSSPVLRGKLVRERLLCLAIAPPPPNLDVTFRPAQDAKTTRDKFRIHSEAPACQACHRWMDPIGFGWEQYDGIGMYRTEENGVAVDASGSLVGLQQGPIPFQDGTELHQSLANQPDIKACMVRNVLIYNLGKTSFAQDGCVVAEMMQQMPSDEPSFATMYLAWLGSSSFRYRTGEKK